MDAGAKEGGVRIVKLETEERGELIAALHHTAAMVEGL